MIGNNSALKQRAQSLRKAKNATPQEKQLWYHFLKDHPLQFHRQVTFGSYIVDFYCPALKLVIEIDGSQHYEPDAMKYDAIRTDYLNACGCTVVRYSNYDVDHHFSSVCEDILRQMKQLEDKNQ